MKVFVSYSRKDEAIAHLLSYILSNKGVMVLIDRKLETGEHFDEQLQRFIKEADIILLLVTENSQKSAWVQQELGFAIARSKKIWPIVLERDLELTGMISGVQHHVLFDWSEPQDAIERLVSELVKGNPKISLDQAIIGKQGRTDFLVEKLKDLLSTGKCLRICHQAAFSIFAASCHPEYATSHHTIPYIEKLLQERALLDELVRRPDVKFQMILWPRASYGSSYLARRYRTLLEWLENVQDASNIEIVIGMFNGANCFIAENEFVLEGRKTNDLPGYETTLFSASPQRINNAIVDFENRWSLLSENNQDPIKVIQNLLEKTLSPSSPDNSS